MAATDERAAKWSALQAPFEKDEIELLPKPFQKDAPKSKCDICNGYHSQPAVHLSYVGHAGITKRLLDVDPEWNWEPLALTDAGTPLMSDGGMWIRLTVLGVTRLGFGDAQGKSGPNATKEIIGDALRNAAMRFGVGTYLWSKSEKAKAELTRQGADDDSDDQGRTYGASSEGRKGNPAKTITPGQAGKLVKEADSYGYSRADVVVTASKRGWLTVPDDGRADLCELTNAQMDELLAAMKAHPKTAGQPDVAGALGAEVIGEYPNEGLQLGDEEIPF